MNVNPSMSTMPPWQVLLVDDEPAVHDVTRLVLRDLTFSGRQVVFHSAYTGEQCVAHLAAHPDTALVLLDVVMETDDAGLVVVRRIREELRNADVQIVLRTGHPGMAPEAEVVTDYEINGYFVKTELTARRLVSVVIAGLRSYQYVRALQQAHVPQDDAEAAAGAQAGAEEAIAQALHQSHYRLRAQCQYDLVDGGLAAVALLPEWPASAGWTAHAEIGSQVRSPALLEAINDAVLRRACALAGAWLEHWDKAGDATGAAGWPPRISVPVLLPRAASGDTVALQALPGLVRQALAACGLPGSALDLLLPGNLPATSAAAAEAARDVCAQIRAQGVSITLSDIGSGPISLSHLRRLLPDRLQIAASHVRDVADDLERAAIARAVIALAHTLGVRVLADGIASAAELQFFKWEGCDHGQGDLPGPPWDAADWPQALPRA